MRGKDITREEVFGLVEEARGQHKNKKDHVREKLIRDHPGIENEKVSRNGHTFNLLDYLLSDIESYGPST